MRALGCSETHVGEVHVELAEDSRCALAQRADGGDEIRLREAAADGLRIEPPPIDDGRERVARRRLRRQPLAVAHALDEGEVVELECDFLWKRLLQNLLLIP
jgi:hypothetical protein|tara:strand:- start:248 stop:553 length:306 start_codon:yes stop_codon:yes gene_type:complete